MLGSAVKGFLRYSRRMAVGCYTTRKDIAFCTCCTHLVSDRRSRYPLTYGSTYPLGESNEERVRPLPVSKLLVQYYVLVSPWNTSTSHFISPMSCCQDIGALPLSTLHDVTSHSGTTCFVRPMRVNLYVLDLSAFDVALCGPHAFKVVIRLNRALTWVATWEQRGRAAQLWGVNMVRWTV